MLVKCMTKRRHCELWVSAAISVTIGVVAIKLSATITVSRDLLWRNSGLGKVGYWPWKVLNSLTWDSWFFFFLINGNLRMFQLTFFYLFVFFCKNSYISWILPYLFTTILESYLRGCVLDLNPQCMPNKTEFSALTCALFQLTHAIKFTCFTHFSGL